MFGIPYPFILIIIIGAGQGDVSQQKYNDEASCKAAQERVEALKVPNVYALCVPS